MAKQKKKLVNPIAVDPDGISVAQAVAGAGALTMTGALTSGGAYAGDFARRIGILSAADDSLITFTVTGTDAEGKAISEIIAGSAGAPGTVETTLYFKDIAAGGIVASGAAAGNVSAGTVDEIATNMIPLDKYNHNPATVSCENISGAINYTVQETFSDFQNTDNVVQWYNVDGLDIRTGAGVADITNHATAVRLISNSYASGAQLNFVINQDRP